MLKRLTFVHWSHPNAGGYRYQLQMSALIAGLLWAVLVTLFAGVILVLWVTLSQHPTYNLSGVIGLCMLGGALVGGGIGGLNARKQGWLHGGVIGLTYGIIFLAMMAGGNMGALKDPLVWIRLPLLAVLGALGGVAGVNLSGTGH